jgi:hypothetical protein
VKPHLIVASAVDEDAVPLAVVASEAVGMLRAQLARIKSDMKTKPAEYVTLAAEARNIANTIAKVLDAARKVMEDGAAVVDAMSFQEKAALIIEWTASLPSVYRRRLITQMMEQDKSHLASAAEESASVN